MRSARGMTLMEAMIAVAISTLVVTAAMSVVNTGMGLSRQQEQNVNSNMAARSAMEVLLRDLRLAGTGAPGGIWVALSGTTTKIQPMFSLVGGTANADDLWVVVPRPQMLVSDCTTAGSSAVVTASGAGALSVNCTSQFANTDTLMVTNFRTGALINGLTLSTNTINFAQSTVSGFSSAPEKGGFQRGDVVFAVDIFHYVIATGADGKPVMRRNRGGLNPGAGAPFVEVAQGQTFGDIDDLQFSWGTQPAGATEVTYANVYGALYDAARVPMSLRVSVVGRTRNATRYEGGQLASFSPMTVEDHVPVAAPDGYRRAVYRRRVELINMNAVNL